MIEIGETVHLEYIEENDLKIANSKEQSREYRKRRAPDRISG